MIFNGIHNIPSGFICFQIIIRMYKIQHKPIVWHPSLCTIKNKILIIASLVLIPYQNVLSVWIYPINGIVMTIRIRADAVVFLAERIHCRPPAHSRVVQTRAKVVEVEAVLVVPLLAQELQRLHIGVRVPVAIGTAIGIVTVALNIPSIRHNLAHTAQVVANVITVSGVLA